MSLCNHFNIGIYDEFINNHWVHDNASGVLIPRRNARLGVNAKFNPGIYDEFIYCQFFYFIHLCMLNVSCCSNIGFYVFLSL